MREIVIADDDIIVRRYLEQIINDELPDFRLCGVAQNGREAIELIREKKPDLAIIDIDMPEKDGVEVLYQLKKENISPKTKVVVLSCYNDFGYVKNAMKYGAVDYILKYKVDTETLAKILENVFLDEPVIQVFDYKKSDSKRNENKDDLLKKLLFAEEKGELENEKGGEWEDILSIKSENILVVVGRIDYHDKFIIHNTEEEILNVNVEIMKIISEYTATYEDSLAACIDENRYILIFGNLLNTEKDTVKINQTLSLIKQEIEKKLCMTITFGVSENGGNITNIAAYYEKALLALRYKLYVGTNSIIQYEQCKFCDEIPAELKEMVNEWSKKKIFLEESIKLLEKIFNSLKKLRLRYSQYNLFLIQMVGIVIAGATDGEVMNKVFGDVDVTTVFLGCETCEDHYNWFFNHINRLKEGVKEQKYRTEIEQAIEYIEENLGEPITLSQIAVHVNFSKNYFSMLFKQNVGENLMDYIARARINKAKELLVNSNDKIYEIAESVGFESQHYFNRLFKSLVGVTPTEYRNIKFLE